MARRQKARTTPPATLEEWEDAFATVTMEMSTFLRGLDENGGLAQLSQHWPRERLLQWRDQAGDMDRAWKGFVVSLHREAHRGLTIVKDGPGLDA